MAWSKLLSEKERTRRLLAETAGARRQNKFIVTLRRQLHRHMSRAQKLLAILGEPTGFSVHQLGLHNTWCIARAETELLAMSDEALARRAAFEHHQAKMARRAAERGESHSLRAAAARATARDTAARDARAATCGDRLLAECRGCRAIRHASLHASLQARRPTTG